MKVMLTIEFLCLSEKRVRATARIDVVFPLNNSEFKWGIRILYPKRRNTFHILKF